MSDIVERLREMARLQAADVGSESEDRLAWMAGDEIERLRLDAENGWAARDHWKKKCEAKDAVVEAAEPFADAFDTWEAGSMNGPTDCLTIGHCRALRDALRAMDAAKGGDDE